MSIIFIFIRYYWHGYVKKKKNAFVIFIDKCVKLLTNLIKVNIQMICVCVFTKIWNCGKKEMLLTRDYWNDMIWLTKILFYLSKLTQLMFYSYASYIRQ